MPVGELGEYIVTIAGVLGALSVIGTAFGFVVRHLLKPIRLELRREDIRSCRMFLVGFLCDVENGIVKDEVQWKLAHEIYDHYTKELNENSYVHDKWERIVNHSE